MTNPSDPPDKPTEPQPKDQQADASRPDPTLDLIAEVLAKTHGEAMGKQGAELRAHIADVVEQVKTVAVIAAAQNTAEADREKAAVEVERLLDTVMRTGPAMAKAIEPVRDVIAKQLRGVDIESIANVMRLLADWLHKPDAQTEAQIKQLVARLQETMGPMIGHDPVAEGERRRADIKAGVKKSLDKIFEDKSKKT
jgi:hypothetical protein